MAAKKSAKKAMGKKSMKKTKGGAVDAFMPPPTQQGAGLLLPAVQKVREAANNPSFFQGGGTL